jgi:multidrug efflux system membrane fusion protein
MLIATIALTVAGGAIAAYYMQPAEEQARRGRGRFAMDGAVPVLAVPARLADVPVHFDGVGTARALNTVTVRPQVEGKLIAILFKEGEDVRRGDVLARIDATTYQAQHDQAVAKKAQDEAQLANARLDLERYTRLAATNSATKQQLDTQRALVAQLEAQAQLDQAAIDNTKAILNYTNIVAPIDGRTGIRLVDEGNIVRASDATGIVVITQVKPIAVLFNLPQQQLADVVTAMARGTVPVEAFGADNRTIIGRGTLSVIDNQVDPATGTVRLKGEFPNADLQLWPGQFVNVRVLVDTLRQVVVVPTGAVQRGPTGTYVYVMQPDDKVALRTVTVSRQDDTQAVIADGLQPGDRVVTTGFARLQDGTQVRITGEAPAPPAQPGAAGGPRRPPGPQSMRREGGAAVEGGGSEARRPRTEGARRPAP